MARRIGQVDALHAPRHGAAGEAERGRSDVEQRCEAFADGAADGGRARFSVDGGHLRREFVVGLPRVLVRVTGTRFTLVADPAGDRVRVDQGEVRCDAGGLRGLPIIAGREGVFAAGAPPRIADLDAGANTRPLPIADAAWQLLELRGTGSHRTPGYRATLDFVLDGAAEAEAWAALVAEPGTADWSRAAGVELT